MKTHMIVTMPDGSVWSVPTGVIAENRAATFGHLYGNSMERSLKEDTLPLFELDTFEIEDWAQNSMSWSDVVCYATQVSGAAPVDYEDGWANGKKRFAD